MKWPWQSEQVYRQAGTQKLAELIEHYDDAQRSDFGIGRHVDPAMVAQRDAIEKRLRDVNSYDPNLVVQVGTKVTNLLLLLLRCRLQPMAALLFDAGFDSTLPAHRTLASQMVALQVPLRESWERMRSQGYDFTQPLEDGETSLLEFAITQGNPEAITWLIEYGFDPLAIPSRMIPEFHGSSDLIEIKPVNTLATRLPHGNPKCDRLLTLLVERGLILLAQESKDWSPKWIVSYDGTVHVSQFKNYNPVPLKALYDRYAPAIHAYCHSSTDAPNPATGWQDKDLLTIYGCGLLPQALDPLLWQGNEVQLYALYQMAPEHIQTAMQEHAPDLLQLAEAKAVTRIMGPVQHWEIGVSADAPAKGAAR